ncbi:hypothetical protein DB459_10895 [Bradyrhizobium sp. WD16]|nr:hypothetical protein DB459_10895 [Bradyrhizobium sp. WD16]
MRARQHTVRMP